MLDHIDNINALIYVISSYGIDELNSRFDVADERIFEELIIMSLKSEYAHSDYVLANIDKILDNISFEETLNNILRVALIYEDSEYEINRQCRYRVFNNSNVYKNLINAIDENKKIAESTYNLKNRVICYITEIYYLRKVYNAYYR